MARNPNTTWNMLNEAMLHFQRHIEHKHDRYSLTFVDLLYVSNFKGGNASITESISTLPSKLAKYESVLREIDRFFGERSLEQLSPKEMGHLISLCDEFFKLTANSDTKIRGFGPSYGSALLAAYFISLLPVLDRRILNGAGIIVSYNSQKQVKNISQHFEELVKACQAELKKRKGLTLRELDMEWFGKALE